MMIFIGRNNFLLDWYSFHTFVMSICNVTSEESPENKRKKFEINAIETKKKSWMLFAVVSHYFFTINTGNIRRLSGSLTFNVEKALVRELRTLAKIKRFQSLENYQMQRIQNNNHFNYYKFLVMTEQDTVYTICRKEYISFLSLMWATL